MSGLVPTVDVNLFAFNAEATIAPAIESVLAQTWPCVRLTVIDNGSTDATPHIAARYCADLPNVRLHRARANAGALVNCQRAFTLGEADFVMPKTADDIVAPTFIEAVMAVLLDNPGCAMCHASGIIFRGDGRFQGAYPDTHHLHATGADPVRRAADVMRSYTSAPSFWGIYRRSAVDRLSRFRFRAGWDHVVLAELALYGEITHVPDKLYFRRDGGRPVYQIGRACGEGAQRGGSADDLLADLRWLTPRITTAHAHLEAFAVAPLPLTERLRLLDLTQQTFRTRWHSLLREEAAVLAGAVPRLLQRVQDHAGPIRGWLAQQIAEAILAVLVILPDDPAAPALHALMPRLAASQPT